MSSCSSAELVDCGSNQFNPRVISEIKQLILNEDYDSLLSKAYFPLEVQIYGSTMSMDRDTVEHSIKHIFTDNIRESLNKAKLCDIAKMFGLVELYGKINISQMIFNLNYDDTRLASSGIPSVSELQNFITKINKHIVANQEKSIGHYVHYPFRTENGLEIRSKEDFDKNVKKIITPKFLKLFKLALDESNFHLHYSGIRLNYEGNIWIQYINGELKLVLLNW